MASLADKHIPLARQIIVFCSVGVFNTLSCLAIIFALSSWLDAHYIVANIVGYGSTMIMGFCLHRYITFRQHNQTQTLRRQITAFLLVSGLAYVCQLGFLIALVEFVRIPEMMAQVFSIALYVFVSFAGNKFITFPEDRELP